jgi:iron only hydrogenase large subunit-like protein
MQGIKKAEIKIGALTLKVAVVATMKNAEIILQELQDNPKAYDYVEVMACLGGCIGGGGQPIPSTEALVVERTKELYEIDRQKTIRKAHLNPVVQAFFDYLQTIPEQKKHQILHRSYHQKSKFE